jgi:aminopeptidase N
LYYRLCRIKIFLLFFSIALESTIGAGVVDKAFQNYFKLWKFKHPQPEDMKAAFEQSINKSLNQYFSLLNKEDQLSE